LDPWNKPASNEMEATNRNPTHSNKSVIRLEVKVERFHGVASWSWNANDEVCGICQSAFEGTAPGVKYPGEDCPVVWGKCGHAYHLQCVSKWLSQPSSKNSCPICRQEWEFGQNPVNAESRN
jgi:anaphase-promoting complex subunit 11